MINLEAQRAKFVDSFHKATGINREFAEAVFSYTSFHNSVDTLAGYFGWSSNLSYLLKEDGCLSAAFSGDKGALTIEEVYKLYKEVTAS